MKKITSLLFILLFMFFISCDFFLDILLMGFPTNFDKITYEDIKEAFDNGDLPLNGMPINIFLLMKKKILLYQTNSGNLGKLKVIGINDTFSFDYMTFNNDGTTLAEGKGVNVGSGYYDLDASPSQQGVIAGSEDFNWSNDEISMKKALFPMNVANFGFPPNSVSFFHLNITKNPDTCISCEVVKQPDFPFYYEGTTIRLNSFPAGDFINWTGDNASELNGINPAYIIMSSDKCLTANFTLNTLQVMYSAIPIPNDAVNPMDLGEITQGSNIEFIINNVGTSTITVSNITIASNNNGFYLSGNPSPCNISVGGAIGIMIKCNQLGIGLISDTIKIVSDGIPNPYQFKIKCNSTTGLMPSITATPGALEESIANDGTLTPNVITVDLMNGTFDLMNIPSCVNLINLPAGLTRGTVSFLSSTQISFQILGAANPHTNAQDITIYVQIIPNGITGYSQAVSSNSIFIDFDPIKVIPTPSVLHESTMNDGTILEGSISLNLYNGTYVSTPPITMANIIVHNLPAGLIINTINPVSNTTLELPLTGAATAHGTANNTELFFTILAGVIDGVAFDIVSTSVPIEFIDFKGN